MKTNLKHFASFIFVIIVCLFGTAAVSAQCDCTVPPKNCAVPLSSIQEQGYQASGVEGGITVMDVRQPVDPSQMLMDVPITQKGKTAILVVDSFRQAVNSSDKYRLPPEVAQVTDDASLEKEYNDGVLTHGALVFNHINAILQGAFPNGSNSPDDNEVEWSSSSADVIVRMVDAMSYKAPFTDTTTVASALNQAMRELNNQGVERFVVNMSFAVLPCDIADKYDVSKTSLPDEAFRIYADSVATAAHAYYSALITPAETSLHPDALHYLIGRCSLTPAEKVAEVPVPDYLKEFAKPAALEGEISCDPSKQTISFIGSAGNSNLSFPFYPAHWDEVLSVSAEHSNTHKRADYSNYNAKIGLLGGWYRLVNGGGISPNIGTAPIFYKGTSFSAPVASVCFALGIQMSAPACQSISDP